MLRGNDWKPPLTLSVSALILLSVRVEPSEAAFNDDQLLDLEPLLLSSLVAVESVELALVLVPSVHSLVSQMEGVKGSAKVPSKRFGVNTRLPPEGIPALLLKK